MSRPRVTDHPFRDSARYLTGAYDRDGKRTHGVACGDCGHLESCPDCTHPAPMTPPPDPVAALAEALWRTRPPVLDKSQARTAAVTILAYLPAGWSLSHDSEREALVAVTDDLELMLRYRHDEAHNGDIVRFGPIETCGLCEPVWLHIDEARAAIEGRP